MNKRIILALLTVCTAVALAVATGAAPTSGNDRVHEQVILAPTDGPNGGYALSNSDGEIELLLTNANPNVPGAGVSEDTLTPLSRVFTVTYTGDTHARIWLADDADSVTFFRGDNIENTVEGRPNAIMIAPNQTVFIGILVDTRGEHDVSQASSFTLNAELANPESGAHGDVTTSRPTGTPSAPDMTEEWTGGGSSGGSSSGGGTGGGVGGSSSAESGAGGTAGGSTGSANGSNAPTTEVTSTATRTPTATESTPTVTSTTTNTPTDEGLTTSPTTGPTGTPTEMGSPASHTAEDVVRPTQTTSDVDLEAINQGAAGETGLLSEFPVRLSELRWLLPLFFLVGIIVLLVAQRRMAE